MTFQQQNMMCAQCIVNEYYNNKKITIYCLLILPGGVTLLRAAAKNHARVTVICDPDDYVRYVMAFIDVLFGPQFYTLPYFHFIKDRREPLHLKNPNLAFV